MNDPALQDPIADASHSIDGDGSQYDGADDEAEMERQYLDPSRWWFASTACPLIAGTFGPMANAFNICALGSYWRETIPPGGSENSATLIRDPPWLTAVNAVSLACSLAANAALLFNMANRGRFELTQAVTIAGFFVASLLLIGLLGAASRQSFLGAPEAHALSQAFYYAIWAAAIYMILSVLMLLTVWGAMAGKYEKRYNLKTSQRTLMLQTISFMVYLLVGALIFSTVEGWAYLDAVFWADFTLLTIGLGSPLVPVTHTGRSLLIPYAIGGIVSVGLIIGSIRSMLLETAKEKIKARTTEKMRSRVHSYADVQNHRPGIIPDSHKHRESAALPERERRRREFHAMRALQSRADSRNKWYALLVSTTAALTLWFVGALVFHYTEYLQGWSYFAALYFAYTSLLTIGYGDYTPLSNSGRAFFVFWSLLAIPTLTVLISDMGDTVVKAVRDATNYLGSLTLLPSAGAPRSAWRAARARLSARARARNPDSHAPPSSPAAILRARLPAAAIARARAALPPSPCTSASAAATAPVHRHLLAAEAARLLADSSATPPRRFAYDEWAYFLLLLGHDEGAARSHRRRASGAPVAHGELGRPIDAAGRAAPWSWMGLRSPLMARAGDAEWLLGQVVARLGREMARGLEGADDDGGEDAPVSLDMLRELLAEEGDGDVDVDAGAADADADAEKAAV